MKPDPFQRQKDIRAGKLDSELPAYDEITGWFQRVPMTWLPALLVNIVKQCVARHVFVDKKSLLKLAEAATQPDDFLR